MRRPFLMLSILLLASLVAAQNNKQDFLDGEFFFAEEEYEEALYAFTQVYNRGYEDNANINYRMGLCLLQVPGRKTESIPYLEKAIGSITERYREGSFKEENAPPDAHLYLGNAYRINMDLEKAIEQYKKFSVYQDPKNEIQNAFVEQQIKSCENAMVAINNPVEYNIGNLGQVNETQRNRYNLVVSNDLSTMAFMGKNPFYNSVQVSVKQEDGTWGRPLNITPSIVSDGNMDVVALTPDGKTMLLAVSDEFDSNIYSSTYENDRWNPATSLGSPINSRYYESHATYSPDVKSIYFTSNRSESMGGMDIFRSDLQDNGEWGDPVNLGPNINTVLNEESPFISTDGKRMYFSSQGHSTIGGYDLFYSELQADGSWGEPVNPGFPLNTTDDDLAFTPQGVREDGTSILFSQGHGSGFDLFKFEFIGRDETPVVVPMGEIEEEVAEEVVAEVTEVEEVEEVEQEVVQETIEETVEEVVEEAETEVEEVKPPERYLIKPVFFDFDSYALSGASKGKLDQLTGLMKKFPALKLEVTGHTDALGSFEYNQRLSDNRAGSVANYLASKGVGSDRIKVTGLSEKEHIARNQNRDNSDAPEGRALNRRAQFKVSITGDVIIEMEKINVPQHLRLND